MLSASWTTQSQPAELQNALQVREPHLDASMRQPRAGTFMTIIAQYKGASEFIKLAPSTRRAYP